MVDGVRERLEVDSMSDDQRAVIDRRDTQWHAHGPPT